MGMIRMAAARIGRHRTTEHLHLSRSFGVERLALAAGGIVMNAPFDPKGHLYNLTTMRVDASPNRVFRSELRSALKNGQEKQTECAHLQAYATSRSLVRLEPNSERGAILEGARQGILQLGDHAGRGDSGTRSARIQEFEARRRGSEIRWTHDTYWGKALIGAALEEQRQNLIGLGAGRRKAFPCTAHHA